MSITYEEALETLETMFGAPWTQESLDVVLRHFKGHMENTVEAILGHGDGDPSLLLQKLQSAASNDTSDLDQQLARQLAAQERQQQLAQQRLHQGASSAGGNGSPKKTKGRGTETILPPDFLRIPGYNGRGGSSDGAVMDQDEALARMLQDELFSQELANNPEFAHLARPRTAGGVPTSSTRGRIGEMPTRSAATSTNRAFHAGGGDGFEGPNIMEKLTGMGQEAKKRLQILAAQWSQASSRFAASAAGNTAQPHPSNSAMTLHETRGLLDADDGDEMELSFAKTKDQ